MEITTLNTKNVVKNLGPLGYYILKEYKKWK